jgi:2-desacetyl-2-hydroxyethyl bacteriochlorophyllide A dehydrogenase
MKTIILNQPEQFTLTDTREPEPAPPEEALVKVHRVGICGTDLHAFRGRQPFFEYPRILGHELGVEIIEVPDNDLGLKPGDYCAVEPYLNCGTCIACRQGKTNCCTTLKVLGVHIDGGMREYITVPLNKLHKSVKLTLDQLALVETIGIGAHAVARAQIQPGENVLVIGAGPIGLSTMEMAKAEGANIIVLDVSAPRLEFCRNQLHIEHCIPVNETAVQQIEEITSGEFPTAVFDCTGNEHSMNNAIQYLAHGGRLIFVGLFTGSFSIHDPSFHKRETTLLSSRNSTAADMKRVMRYLEDGKIDSTTWITHRVHCDHLIEQFPRWYDPNQQVIKAMVEWI